MRPLAQALPRRRFVGAAVALCITDSGIAASLSASDASIKREVEFKASADSVYSVLVEEARFGAMTGVAASIEPREGGAFALFAGRVTGRNIELLQNRRIVQAWRLAMWPAGRYSIVRFELVPNSSGTRMLFEQTGLPTGREERQLAGWTEYYFNPMLLTLDGVS